MKKLLVIAGAALFMTACRNDTLSNEAKKDAVLTTTVQETPAKVVYVEKPQKVQYRTATTNNAQVQKRGMSSSAKGAIIGGVGGAVVGGVATKSTKGAVIGGVVGAGAGYIIGRKRDKKSGRIQQ